MTSRRKRAFFFKGAGGWQGGIGKYERKAKLVKASVEDRSLGFPSKIETSIAAWHRVEHARRRRLPPTLLPGREDTR
ncbi:hypothetical protein DA102_034130 [Sinorhizobium meliloti]|nr:hypothetical protein DA102_034130 [Sinorhizobium meliloti]